MPPLRGLGLSSCIVLLLVLRMTCALDLFLPSSISPGENLTVSWGSAPDDPNMFTLDLVCNGSPNILNSSVSTALMGVSVTVPLSLSNLSGSPSPLSCNFQARTVDNTNTLLNETQVMLSVASSAATTSNGISTISTGSSSQSLPTTSTDSFKGSSVPSSTINNTTSSPSQSTTAFGSSMNSATDTSHTASSRSSASPASITTTLSTSASSTVQMASPLTHATTKPIGTIVGAVIGGLLGFFIIAAVLFLCRRRYQRRRMSRQDVEPNISSTPFSMDKEKARLAAEGGTPSEALNPSAAESWHIRSGSSSLGHYYPDSHRGPDDPVQPQSIPFSESWNAIGIPTRTAHDDEDQELQHTSYSSSPSTPEPSIEEATFSHETGRPWNSSPRSTGHDEINQSSCDAFDINKMDEETREQCRDALLERMRRVLEGEQSV
ncbi:hypothetical protein E4T56_gene11950 [Termitomyces sp. T112]|nr:hypothetical protein E4T56_gene11950 [Termitomyces sp. T112]